MSELIRLCRVDEVKEGEPVAAHVAGLPPFAVYDVGGTYYVTDNICTHGNAMLTDGYQDGGTIECPFHGGAFDIASAVPSSDPDTHCPFPVASRSRSASMTPKAQWSAVPKST